MTFPKSTVGYQDGSLGIAAAQTDGIVCVLGYSTLGTTGTLYDFNNASPTEVKATLGKGRLAQMVASLMATPNHGPVIAIPLASTAGTNSAVTSTGTTPPAVTLTGTPYDDGSGIVQIVQAGARGTATFKYSLDGGTTYSPEILTAATYLMDNGVTLNFAVGNYAADNKYTFTCVAPTHSNANITAGLDALIASGRDVGFIGILSANTGATDTDRATAMAATFAAVSTKIDALETAYRYVGCVIEAPSPVATDSSGMTAWRSALVVAGPALSSGEGRMMIAAGYCAKTSDLDALNYRRSSIFPVLERLSQAPISEDLGRVLSGALRGVTSIEHDEEATGGLDSQRYVTLRKVAGRQGFFVTQGNTFAPSGSDYSLCQYTRVINARCV